MFKFVVFSCLVSVAFGGLISHQVEYAPQVKHYVEPQVSIVETPTINHVGSVVKNVPTGVSHHSSSVVHSAANIVEPIYAHGVEKKIVSTPVVKNYVEQVQAVVPVAKAAYVQAPVAYHSAPVAYAAPVAYHSAPVAYQPAPVAYHSAPVAYHSAPIAYQSAVYAPKALSYAAYPATSYASYAPAAYPAAYKSAEYAHHY
jgi:Drosophila Retinin like protein